MFRLRKKYETLNKYYLRININNIIKMLDSYNTDDYNENIISDNERCVSILEKLLMRKKEKKSCFKRYFTCFF
jgi:hypothetical protein